MKKIYYQKIACTGLLVIIFFVFQKYTSKDIEDFSDVKFILKSSVNVSLSEFNPNDLNEKQWEKLGFSNQQVKTILNYKTVVGGEFISKEQFKKCFAVSPEKFSELNSYILLPEINKDAKSHHFEGSDKKSIHISITFNPDHYLLNDWIKLGFSERQAEAILKYKNYLGGSFVSKEKFKECFIINDDNYRKLAPFLILPEKTPVHFKRKAENFNAVKKTINSHFDPNILDLQGWQKLGFSEGQAKVIIHYRDRNLKGSFKNLEDIQKCFVISEKKFNELKPYIILNSATFTKNKEAYKAEIKQEKTNFSETDLNSIHFRQLLEFGLDEKSAGSIIGFRKKLGGFVTKEQILETYNIDKDWVGKLISVCPLNTSGIEKYTLADAPEEWLKNHPYFKYSADKIIFYRISYPEDKKIWKFLKLKPEYEARMKLYLK